MFKTLQCLSRHFTLFALPALVLSSINIAVAEAPTDISNNQRAWYDAVDINANSDYSDNPSNNSLIGLWQDKSGSGNHVSGAGTARPIYRHDVFAVSRHGVDFDGVDNVLVDSSDIWTGAVNMSEIFFMMSTDQVKKSFNFLSTDFGNNRLGSHVPWSNGTTYFDQGLCCGNPTRLQGTLPITLNEPYLWQYIGLPTLQSVVRNGDTLLSDGGAGVYNTNANTQFSLGGRFSSSNLQHHGKMYEVIFYQSTLNNAQRRILNSYLVAKWDRTMAAGVDYADVYVGDNSANGDYDFFVGGIGQDGGVQSFGTSEGLTITDSSFLTADDKFVLAGVDYLLSAPTTGQVTSDLPVQYRYRSNRTWFIDTSGTGGVVDLTFNAADIGIPVNNGREYGLLHRTGTSGPFSEVAKTTMASGELNFTMLPADGVYAIGIIEEVDLALEKSVSDEFPDIGDIVTFTLKVSNAGPDAAIKAWVVDSVPAGFGNLVAGSAPVPSLVTLTGNTIDWTNISIGAGSSASLSFTAEVLDP